MRIDFMSGFGSVQPYYRASEIPAVTPSEIEKQNREKAADTNSKANEMEPDTRSRVTDFDKVSLTFNKEESFDYIGSESGLADLDVRKAISDMKRDSVLQEYQYFVGSAQTLINPEDGFVFQK